MNFTTARISALTTILAVFSFLLATTAAETILQSGGAVAGISGARSSNTYFKINVPAAQARLEIKISNPAGAGDCDLYVKFGAQPTLSSWDYRPYRSDSNETVTVNNPTAGDWFILLNGYTAYSSLSLVATITGAQGTAAVPTFSPASGTYTGEVLVSMATATAGAMIRYTTDGTDPTTSSTVYSAPLMVTGTVTVKARAFMSGLTMSGVATASYTVIPGGATTLESGVAKTNLSGALDSQVMYRIFVPAGQTNLAISISSTSNSGDCDLYVKQGAEPTLSTFDYRPYLGGSNETVSVSSPASGYWYIMLHG